ncbi:hypothetical protein ACGFRG_00020 [Streptomyces sp. NPDC048696]|uniref:hypothetical protein n=1 Tax=Streptomyces sp. NPDC048696 TaxID=3365585 RepID=UPI0037211E8D
MGFTSAWSVSVHDDAFINALRPRLLPSIAAERSEPFARERWERWRREPLPDFRTWWQSFGRSDRGEADALRSFHELTTSGEHIRKMYDGLSPEDDFCLLTHVWDLVDGEDIFLSVHSKDFALRSFFHAIGPERAALLPGWCGNFLLTATQARHTLPAIERALAFTHQERAAAQDQDWLDYRDGEESVLDGPLRMWRKAVTDGRGLCGVSVIVC